MISEGSCDKTGGMMMINSALPTPD